MVKLLSRLRLDMFFKTIADALFPWMAARENIAYPLLHAKV
jgi:ABC-type taurine transport system ATPase subunit